MHLLHVVSEATITSLRRPEALDLFEAADAPAFQPVL
jgi:hypothetical protein